MPSQRDPYKVFAKNESWMQIQRADTPKMRCQEMWRTLRSIWQNQMTLEEILVEHIAWILALYGKRLVKIKLPSLLPLRPLPQGRGLQ